MTFWFELLAAAFAGAAIMWLLMRMLSSSQQPQNYAGLKHQTKVQSFRFCTALAAWALLVAAFFYYPRFIQQSLRALSRGIESLADALPTGVGAYVEIGLRELGGHLWIQITAIIILVRVVCSLIAMSWRAIR
jgi:predicted membrane-bound mannosyltransferase